MINWYMSDKPYNDCGEFNSKSK